MPNMLRQVMVLQTHYLCYYAFYSFVFMSNMLLQVIACYSPHMHLYPVLFVLTSMICMQPHLVSCYSHYRHSLPLFLLLTFAFLQAMVFQTHYLHECLLLLQLFGVKLGMLPQRIVFYLDNLQSYLLILQCVFMPSILYMTCHLYLSYHNRSCHVTHITCNYTCYSYSLHLCISLQVMACYSKNQTALCTCLACYTLYTLYFYLYLLSDLENY